MRFQALLLLRVLDLNVVDLVLEVLRLLCLRVGFRQQGLVYGIGCRV